MTEKLLSSYKRDITELLLVPHEGGRFEVSIDGELIYSKLETGEFPEHDSIISAINKRRV